jgi:hypothetical protein
MHTNHCDPNLVSDKMSQNERWRLINRSINENDFTTFKICLNADLFKDATLSRPRFINDAIHECLKNDEYGCEFLELLLSKLYIGKEASHLRVISNTFKTCLLFN